MTEKLLDIFNQNKKGENDVLIIAGPTCSGKSGLALSLAKFIDIEIVSCDSMQIYKYMNIGTAKATETERALVPHHMIDIIPPWENYNAFLYKEAAMKIIDDILSRGKLPVVCGGTGLYVNTLIDNREFSEEDTEKETLYANSLSKENAYAKLIELDPKAAEVIHENNEKRVKRALALYLATGKTMAERNALSHEIPPKYSFTTVCLMPERDKLYRNIDIRVEKMFEMGLFDEAKSVYEAVKKNVPQDFDVMNLTSLSAIGYKELLTPENVDLYLAKEQIKLNTRHYAKRQITWFKKTPGAVYLEV